MRKASIGKRRHKVTLDDPEAARHTPVTFSPSTWWCEISTSAPSAFDENKVIHVVEGPYHSQISYNTRLTFNGRHLWVRGVQNVEQRNIVLVLHCEETVTATGAV